MSPLSKGFKFSKKLFLVAREIAAWKRKSASEPA
jgi:hypothetical protein